MNVYSLRFAKYLSVNKVLKFGMLERNFVLFVMDISKAVVSLVPNNNQSSSSIGVVHLTFFVGFMCRHMKVQWTVADDTGLSSLCKIHFTAFPLQRAHRLAR